VLIKNEKDFYSGLMFMAAGGAFALGAMQYTIGEAAKMGPGYFPLMLGVLLTVLGMAITFKALTVEVDGGEKFGSFAWKPLLCVIGANIVFGICLGGIKAIGLGSLGLIVGIYALVLIASIAAEHYKIHEVLALATALAIGCYAVFIKLLNLQMPVWPSFVS
jgi:Tripartite tricarboxylate transporter TctB family